MKRRNLKKRRIVFKTLGLFFAVAPVLFCVLLYFPVWKSEGGGKIISGGVLLLILLSVLPIVRFIKSVLKSPSVSMLWFLSFLLFFSLSRIAEEMTVISFVGFISNLIGAFFFRLGSCNETEEENEG